jgi:hypothetical protein
MSKPKKDELDYLRSEIKKMTALAEDFDQKAKAIEIAMKFEALQHKLKGRDFGKGFDEPGGDDDGSF